MQDNRISVGKAKTDFTRGDLEALFGDRLPEIPQCGTCQGFRFFTFGTFIPNTHPLFGEAFPCECIGGSPGAQVWEEWNASPGQQSDPFVARYWQQAEAARPDGGTQAPATLSAVPWKIGDEWGVKVTDGNPEVGDVVSVSSKKGNEWQARITSIEGDHSGGVLCLTERLD